MLEEQTLEDLMEEASSTIIYLIQFMSDYELGTLRWMVSAKEFFRDEADRDILETHSEENTNVMEQMIIVFLRPNSSSLHAFRYI
jgi:hypothetical protein